MRMQSIALLLALNAAGGAAAQSTVTLPAGTVILVRTGQALESATARAGTTFQTTVIEDVSVNGYTVIPARSAIRGVIAYVQPATRQRSGVIQVTFDRLIVAGTSYPIVGKLTSTDSTERRQIDARADSRVVLVGERGGIGAAIAGASPSRSPAADILNALGSMLSEGRDVSVPAGTAFAVQLERSLSLNVRGSANLNDESTIYTAPERIRAAQQALARRAYYRGTADGQLTNATRRALFEFQLDNDITATGNLDGRTATALGILTAGGTAGGAVLSAEDASVLRRAAQAIAARERQDLGISTAGLLSSSRPVTEDEFDLLFAFSAFADNASLYEQFVRASPNTEGAALAGKALINSARRVDSALQAVRPSQSVLNTWNSIRRQLAVLDPSYR